jgi:tetratricopeptide (TPR) repeat protein
MGDALMAQLRYQAAIEAYKKIPHRSAEVWNKMGIAYQMMFNQDEALHCYQSSLRLDPKNSRVMNNLGTIYDADEGIRQRGTHVSQGAEAGSEVGNHLQEPGNQSTLPAQVQEGWGDVQDGAGARSQRLHRTAPPAGAESDHRWKTAAP